MAGFRIDTVAWEFWSCGRDLGDRGWNETFEGIDGLVCMRLAEYRVNDVLRRMGCQQRNETNDEEHQPIRGAFHL